MDILTKERAIQMLKFDIIIRKQHLRKVYVVGKKLFAFRYAAEEWHKQVNHKPIEEVRIEDAYGVTELSQLHGKIKIFNN